MRLLLLFVMSVAAVCVAPTAAQKKVVCYFESWTRYRPGAGEYHVEDIDTSLCTHLNYAFIGLNPDATIKIFDQWGDIDLEGFKRFTDLKLSNPSLKTLISIGGWNQSSEEFSHMAGDPGLRAGFVNEVHAFVRQYNFDGLDLDWEYPAQRGGVPEDKQNFVYLIQELRARFAPEGLLLTAAVGAAVPSVAISYDVPQLAANLDFINLMTYDYHGVWDSVTGINSPLYAASSDIDRDFNTDACVRHWLQQGAPASQLVLGMATYGRTFTVDPGVTEINSPHNGPGEEGPYTQQEGYLSYHEICEKQMAGGWTERFQDEQKVPFTYRDTQWIGYDNIESVRIKSEYANQLGLAGGMIWALDTDDFRGVCGAGRYPLLTTMKNTLG